MQTRLRPLDERIDSPTEVGQAGYRPTQLGRLCRSRRPGP